MGKDRAKRCGDREIICFQLSTLSLIRTEKSLVYFKSPLWKRKRKALSASAMLIRIEQTVWQKRHNVLNLVWHLKGLTIIIFPPPPSPPDLNCGISVHQSHLPPWLWNEKFRALKDDLWEFRWLWSGRSMTLLPHCEVCAAVSSTWHLLFAPQRLRVPHWWACGDKRKLVRTTAKKEEKQINDCLLFVGYFSAFDYCTKTFHVCDGPKISH